MTIDPYVYVTKSECEFVDIEGNARYDQVARWRAQHRENMGTRSDRYKHISGARGEFAVAKATGLEWTGRKGRDFPDVDPIEVRTASRGKMDFGLYIQPQDFKKRWVKERPDTPFVLVRSGIKGNEGLHILQGWYPADMARQRDDWWDGKKWIVPWNQLMTIESLAAVIPNGRPERV